jgi:hypothetical protein
MKLSNKCRICRAPNRQFKTTCSIDCEVILGEKLLAKKKLNDARKERASDKARKEKLKGRRDYIKEAKTAMHLFVRCRDAGKQCISCEKILPIESKLGGGFDAGHYRSVGSAKHLEFDERNIHGQCKHCNDYLKGNPIGYRLGLINRFNVEYVEAIEHDNAPRKLTIDDLKNIKEKYKNEVLYLRETNKKLL